MRAKTYNANSVFLLGLKAGSTIHISKMESMVNSHLKFQYL